MGILANAISVLIDGLLVDLNVLLLGTFVVLFISFGFSRLSRVFESFHSAKSIKSDGSSSKTSKLSKSKKS